MDSQYQQWIKEELIDVKDAPLEPKIDLNCLTQSISVTADAPVEPLGLCDFSAEEPSSVWIKEELIDVKNEPINPKIDLNCLDQSISMTADAPVKPLGRCDFSVEELSSICKIGANGYTQVISGEHGVMRTSIEFSNIAKESPLSQWIIRLVLIRHIGNYRQFPIDTVCSKHGKLPGWYENKKHVMIVHPLCELPHHYIESYRQSIVFPVILKNGSATLRSIPLQFVCNASCATTADETYHNSERGRMIVLVATLEAKEDSEYKVYARGVIPIWMKATINERDLSKKQRMGPRGGAAIKLHKKDPLREFSKQIFKQAKDKGLSVSGIIRELNTLKEVDEETLATPV